MSKFPRNQSLESTRKMSRWSGPAGKGAMRQIRTEKRTEAEIRQYEEKVRERQRELDITAYTPMIRQDIFSNNNT